MGVVEDLREYRLKFNKKEEGIAIFDLVLSFLGAYILDRYTNISNSIPVKNKNQKKFIYYNLVIPTGIVFHYLFNVDSFLSEQLFNSNINIYKVLMIMPLIAALSLK